MPFDPECTWNTGGYTSVKTLYATQLTRGRVDIQLLDEQGNPIDVSDYIPDDDGGGSSSSSSVEHYSTGPFLVAKDYAADTSPLMTVLLDIVDAPTGQVRWSFEPDEVPFPGLWLAQVILYKDDVAERVIPYYLYIRANIHASTPQNYYPLHIADVRMYLRDMVPEANTLLEDYEFTDDEIMYAIRRPVDQWNETPPPVGCYTTTTFPYRYYWTIAAAAELLQMAAHRYARNELDYAAAGVRIQDQNKAQTYLAVAERLKKEWMWWLEMKKMEVSALQCNWSQSLYTTRY